MNDQNRTTKKKEKPSAIDIAIAQDQLNSLREENGIATPAGTALSGTPLMRFSMCAPTVCGKR